MVRWLLPATLLAGLLCACGGGSDATPTPTASQPPAVQNSAVVPVEHPAGEDIAYVQAGALWLMGADGSGEHEIYSPTKHKVGGYVYRPEWSPDGTQIAFTLVKFVIAPRKATYSDVSTLIIIEPDGDIVSEAPGGFLPHWSPDGTRVIYMDEFDETDTAFSGVPTIMVVAGGDATTRLARITTFDTPRWSPDGSKLAYSGDDGLHVVDLAGQQDRIVLANEPGASRQYTFWSGDGRLTAFEPRRAEFFGCGYCPIPGWGGEYVSVDIESGALSRVSNNNCATHAPDFVSHPQPMDGFAIWLRESSSIALLPLCDTGFTVGSISDLHDERRYPIAVTGLTWLDLSPDGKSVLGADRSRISKVFDYRDSGGATSAHIVNLETGTVTEIDHGGTDAVWRP